MIYFILAFSFFSLSALASPEYPILPLPPISDYKLIDNVKTLAVTFPDKASEKYWASFKERFNTQVSLPVESFEIEAITTQNFTVIEMLGNGAAGTAWKVKWNGQFYALKVYNKTLSSQKRFRISSFNIQKLLGEIGLAPKVFGSISKEKIDQLFPRDINPINALYTEYEGGVMMELVSGAVPGRYIKDYANSDAVNQLYATDVKSRLDFINLIMNFLEVQIGDPDLLIDSTGRIVLNDFDGYSMAPDSPFPDNSGPVDLFWGWLKPFSK